MRVLMSGGTGFVGRTFLDGLPSYNSGEPLQLTLLSRDPQAFAACHPEFASSRFGVEIRLVRQILPELDLDEAFDVVLHGAEVPATNVTTDMVKHNDAALRAMLSLAQRAGARRFVYLSSGAVYALDPKLEPPFEVQVEFPGADSEADSYAWSKYKSEREVRRACREYGMSHVILRVFNVASRHVPLHGRYALGNFVGDLLDDNLQSIMINGSGRDRRSFISGHHLAGLIFHSLQEAPDDTIYNASSNDEISIAELAALVCDAAGRDKPVNVAMPYAPARHYSGEPNIPRDFLSTRDDIRHEIARLLDARSAVSPVG